MFSIRNLIALSFLFFFLLIPGCSSQSIPILNFSWETPSALSVPESVCYDAADHQLFVSNIDGDPSGVDSSGFISILSLDGHIEQLHWLDGLNAPKGMGISDGRLYVADITRVAEIDIASGKILAFYAAEGSEFLNDICVTKDGDILISDTNTKRIYRLRDSQMSLWLEAGELAGANGLYCDAGQLCMVSFTTGNFYKIDLSNEKVKPFSSGLGAADGLEAIGNGDYLVSNWNGQVNYVRSNGELIELLNTEKDQINAADIELIPSEKLLLIPTFFDNRVRAYQLTYH